MTLTSRTELPRFEASSKARLSAAAEACDKSLARRIVRIVREAACCRGALKGSMAFIGRPPWVGCAWR
jgi:hypothetical protein